MMMIGGKHLLPQLDEDHPVTRNALHKTDPGTFGTLPDAHAARLRERYGHLSGQELLEIAIGSEFPGRIALASSFGAESAVLLHMVSRIDSALPVLFLNTGKLFGETLRYRDELIGRLGLTGITEIKPEPARLQQADEKGVLWRTDPDLCCHIRKVAPLEDALRNFDAWITGRKRFQGGLRGNLPSIEATATHVKINPLAGWRKDDVDAYFEAHGLPRHPLEADGFLSIGCMPCTDRAAPGADARSARWAGTGKTECGIHLPPPETFPQGNDR